MNNEILIVGSSGFIGKHFYNAIRSKYHTAKKNAPFFIDLENPSLDSLPTNTLRYAIIAAACTDILYCENYPEKTYEINVTGTLKLTKLLLEKEIFPILFSSDYVFSGKEGDYPEDFPLSPTTVYGKQKGEIEKRIDQITGGHHLVLRLSKIYSLGHGDHTLLDEMANSLSKKIAIKVATDQIFCPLAVNDLVQIIFMLIKTNKKGLFNLGGKDKLSRYQLAEKLAAALNISKSIILPIHLNDLNPSISRPLNTSLNSKKVFKLLKYHPLSIDQAIQTISRNF